MLKWRHHNHVASQRIQELLGAFLNIQCGIEWRARKYSLLHVTLSRLASEGCTMVVL